jgi:acid phosphatase class B
MPQSASSTTLRIANRAALVYESPMNDHRDIIDRWPSTRAFAEDIGVPYVNVNMMRQRRNIHFRHWDRVVEAAKERGIRGITLKLIASTYRSRPMARADEVRASA